MNKYLKCLKSQIVYTKRKRVTLKFTELLCCVLLPVRVSVTSRSCVIVQDLATALMALQKHKRTNYIYSAMLLTLQFVRHVG
jgi:hypothetical protein